MSYTLKNIALIILILIFMIVIIYYSRNIIIKHDELIEKYTSSSSSNSTPEPTINNTNINTISYTSHEDVVKSIKNSEFPTEGTVVSLRDCQVQFNNTFNTDGIGTLKYVYEDGWQEIDTLKETSASSPITITKKILSKKNETNNNDVNADGVKDFVNYTEHSKCFKKISETDANNKYRYKDNNLIKYSIGNHVELKLRADSASEKYMQMEFDLKPTNSSTFYDNLKLSICSLRYEDTVSGLNGKLIRLSLNAANIIRSIDRVNINSINNHIFNIDTEFDISSLISSGNSGTYNYNNNLYQYITTNSAISGHITRINLYQFDRNLLCDKTSGDTTYQNIKKYKKLNNAKFDVSKLINFNLPPTKLIENTGLPLRYVNKDINGTSFEKNSLLTKFDTLISNELISVNIDTNDKIDKLRDSKLILENNRNTFINDNSKLIFIDNAIKIKNYNDLNLNYNKLIDVNNYDIIIGKVNYHSDVLEISSPSIKISSDEEPTVNEVVSTVEREVFEIMVYTHDGRSELHTPYDITFDKETECDILIVAGGGGGGMDMGGGGGGGGGYRIKKSKNCCWKA